MSIENNVELLDVDSNKISSSAKIFSGSRISGFNTTIGPDCILGEEGPVIIENCRLGRGVRLKGGFYKDSIFLDYSSMGSASHVRKGTLLEEYASTGHCVGFKESIIFPFVKTGSLINFCDAFISGGTDQINHSEIGSSYIHFNYTLNQDKATPSLFGNVNEGVFLDQNPIFLGGQGGAVGPINIAFGSKVTAGSILRNDYLNSDKIISEPHLKEYEKDFIIGYKNNLDRIIEKNLNYIGNIAVLYFWYKEIRTLYISDKFDELLNAGALDLLLSSFNERINQLNKISDIKYNIKIPITKEIPFNFKKNIIKSGNYLSDIKNISADIKDIGKNWMNEIIQAHKIKFFEG